MINFNLFFEITALTQFKLKSRRVRLPAKDGGNAVRLSGTISADRQGWWKCSKIVWNNLC
ncbi:MAG: hypothetical protein HFP76_06905 [Methylococcales symbiont of Iophon sp. n. MRB-2018]|nr:MAG: hypothetical protein HFP76_06905 [Methylococcales symbiont of Iophon sp. n. MRB-2018]